MGFFDGWRKNGGPTLYGPLKTAVTSDVLEAGLIYCAVILAFSLFVVLPGFKGKQIVFAFLRMFAGVFVLSSIVLCNYGQEWEVATIESKTQYRAGLRQDIHAHIAVKIGLRSINITLKGVPEVQQFENGLVNETINYNERFSWDNEGWTQGRMGFGPYAGLFNREYREAQHRGLPYPILWIAEYFTIDGEGIRWGRNYRQAGFFTHALIWTAFCCWILTLALLGLMRRFGGYFSMLTGGCLLLAAILYASIRNPTPLSIPFEDAVLKFHWGWCFVLCLLNGIDCFIFGAVVVALDVFAPQQLATFFDADVTQELEEVYSSQDELGQDPTIYYADAHEGRNPATPTQDEGPDEDYEDPYRPSITVRTYRKRGRAKPTLVPRRKGVPGPSNPQPGNVAGPKPTARGLQVPTNGGASNATFDEEDEARL